jgi:hypothetical protein
VIFAVVAAVQIIKAGRAHYDRSDFNPGLRELGRWRCCDYFGLAWVHPPHERCRNTNDGHHPRTLRERRDYGDAARSKDAGVFGKSAS